METAAPLHRSKEKTDTDFKVFISTRESTCGECGENLGSKAWITLAGEKGALCLACADLDHLVFLPPGNAALTRRARRYSMLSTVVLKWSWSRRRYERQGLLVEPAYSGRVGRSAAAKNPGPGSRRARGAGARTSPRD